MTNRLFSLTLTLLLIGLCASLAFAKTYEGKQRDIDFSSDDLFTIFSGEDIKINDPGEMWKYLFETPVDKLLERAKSRGVSPDIIESTLYVSENAVRFDATIAMMGSVSYVMLPKAEKIRMIFQSRKQYIEMTFDEIQQIGQTTQSGGLLDNLPPEARAQLDQLPPEIREQMKARMGEKSETESKPVSVKKTGRTQTINGFRCEEYIVEGKTKQQIWVSQKYPELRKSFEAVLTKLPNFDKSKDNDDKGEIWEKIRTGWPVVIKEFEFNPRSMRRTTFDVQEIVSMEEKSLPPNVFEVPDGYQKTTMQQMMGGMMPGGRGGGEGFGK
jgi:hypothetical protein